jgi:GNAT superfamily N-acetyltransferase
LLKLIPPGSRKGNEFWLIRGTVPGHREIEVSSKTKDKSVARRLARDIEEKLRRRGPAKAVSTFDDAGERYLAANPHLNKRDVGYVRALIARWRGRSFDELVFDEFVAAADALCFGDSNESKNRKVFAPGAAVLHYAAENRWCPHYKIKRLKTKKAKTRYADEGDIATAIERARGKEVRGLLVWLASHGGRITDTLRVRGEHIDVRRGVYDFYVSKSDKPREKPLAPLLWRYFRRHPPKKGRLFPFNDRWRVYDAIDELGVYVRPHAIRHTVGRRLNARGFGLRTIMEVLDHSTPSASIRYQSADAEIVRRAVGEKPGKRTKS